ncbi:hypothetical protein GVAV_002331 [Gurleya vavrai]
MNRENIANLIQNFEKTNRLTQNINKNILKIDQCIQEAPISVLNSFKIYTEPLENIQAITKFYKIIINAVEDISKRDITITNNSLINEERLIEDYYAIDKILVNLDEYRDIKAVSRYIEKQREYLKKTINPIQHNFFRKLSDEVNYENIKFISFFLIDVNRIDYLQNYCKFFISKFKSKQDAGFVENLGKLGSIFDEINKINRTLIDEKNIEAVGNEIKQMIIIENKNVLMRILVNYEHQYRNENLYTCCKLFLYINQKEVINYFKEYYDEILININNLLLKFIHKIEEIKKPNKEFLSESYVVLSNKIIQIFSNKIFDVFFEKFKGQQEFKSYLQMKDFFCNFLTEKILFLGEKFKGIQKNVYLLNNLNVIIFFDKKYKDKRIIEYIEQYSEEIINIWDFECKKRKESDFTRFLDINLDIQANYHLPDENREMVREKIRDVILHYVKIKKYKKGNDILELKIKKIFAGQVFKETNEKNSVRIDILDENCN